MTVESNNAIAIATRSDWFKNLAPVYKSMKRKTKTNRDCSHTFSKLHHGISTNLDWFIALFVPAVIDRSYYFNNWYLFYNTQLKTAV